jgi:hypothetical protein
LFKGKGYRPTGAHAGCDRRHPLADRALKAGATVLAHTGKPFDAASIGGAVATRAIMADLRAGMDGPLGGTGGGPPPFRKEHRSRFLQALDRELVRLGRVAS